MAVGQSMPNRHRITDFDQRFFTTAQLLIESNEEKRVEAYEMNSVIAIAPLLRCIIFYWEPISSRVSQPGEPAG